MGKKIDLRALKNQLSNIAINEKLRLIDKEAEKKRSFNESLNKYTDIRIGKKNEAKSRIQMLDLIHENMTKAIVMDNLGVLFYESVLLDDEVKLEYKDSLLCFFQENYDKLGGFEYISNSNSPYIKKLLEGAKDITKKKLEKEKSNKDNKGNESGSIELDKEDRNMIDLAKDELDIDMISDVIKDKVVQVVKDESEAAEKEEYELNNLKVELNDIYNSDIEKVNEAFSEFAIRRGILKEESLFSSLMLKYKAEEERTLNESSNTVNMDNVMASAIIEYTLMEMWNTIGVCNYNKKSIEGKIWENKKEARKKA